MATFTSVPAFSHHIVEYSTKIKATNRAAARMAAEAAASAMRRSGSRYRIRGRTGARVSLGAKIIAGPSTGKNAWFLVVADPVGFWILVEHGAKPHEIRPRTYGRRALRNAERRGATLTQRKALKVPGIGYFAKVNHPGTGPIGHPWRDGLMVAKKVGPEAYQKVLIGSVFGKAA